MGVSQKQIAERLDLSIGTVSRSLRGHPDIRPRTRKRVIDLASRMGYQPAGNALRRYGVATEKLVSIGAMVCWSEEIKRNPSAAAYHMLAGISAAAYKMNVTPATHFVSPEQCRQLTDPQHQFPALHAGVLSGLVLIYDFPREIVRAFASRLPCVTLVHPHVDLGADCIDNDHVDGIGRVVDRLYRLGHRRIGFLSNLSGGSWLFPRFAGYMQALKRLELPRDPSIALNVFDSTLDEESQADAIVDHLRRGVTAWVCAGDEIGYNLHRRLTERGLRVPQDVSITGFDGVAPPQGCPKLTTVHQPFEQMGAAAVRRLLHRIKRPDEPVCHIQFGCEFVEGETTGPPAKQ